MKVVPRIYALRTKAVRRAFVVSWKLLFSERIFGLGFPYNPFPNTCLLYTSLGNGELTKKLNVKVNAFSESAKAKIEALGGKAEVKMCIRDRLGVKVWIYNGEILPTKTAKE